MAIPAFVFVESFRQLLPAGLGFASGAMAYVAVFELLTDALHDVSVSTVGTAGLISFAGMLAIQAAIDHD
jgi:zinc transporter ZupT